MKLGDRHTLTEGKVGLRTLFAGIERKVAWSFLGFLLAALFGGIAVYTEFFRNNNPIVVYEIISNTKILDVKEDVTGLNIIYNSEDIRKARKTLSVLVVKIANEGRSPVLKSYYDSNSPLGLSINSGEIIKAEVMTASTEYLRQNARVQVRDLFNMEFSQVIIEPNESLTAKLLILNPEQNIPSINPKGKIAGVKRLILTDRTLDQTQETFLMKVISGSIWVQVIRILTYTVAFILILIGIIGPAIYFDTKKEMFKRNRTIRKFKSRADTALNELNADIYGFYRTHGSSILKRMKKVLANDRQFQSLFKKYDARTSDEEVVSEEAKVVILGSRIDFDDSISKTSIFVAHSVLKLGLVLKTDEGYMKNEEKIKALNEFVQFVATRKA